jgi:hypothetical protein
MDGVPSTGCKAECLERLDIIATSASIVEIAGPLVEDTKIQQILSWD